MMTTATTTTVTPPTPSRPAMRLRRQPRLRAVLKAGLAAVAASLLTRVPAVAARTTYKVGTWTYV